MSRELRQVGCPSRLLGSYWGAPTIPQAGLSPARTPHLFTAQVEVGLAYLVLYAKDALGVSVVGAGRLLALAQAGGTGGRLWWGIVSDWLFGGRRRPGLIITALVGAAMYAIFAGGLVSPRLAIPLAVAAGVGAFGWVGLYFALVAEIGGVRYAGSLTGVAVAFAWSGVLVGPPIFGLILDATGSYTLPWLVLSTNGLLVAMALSRLRPLVQRN